MQRIVVQTFFMIGIMLVMSCRSEFEKLRISGDSAAMFEAAKKYYEEGEYNRSNILYEMIIPSYRGKSEAEEIAYNFAHGHYLNGSHVLSSHYFKNFATTYTSSPRKEQALFLSAISYYKLSPRHQLDQSDSQAAIDAFQMFINAYPSSEKIAECNGYIDNLRLKMELKAFESGKMYYNTRNYSSAITSLENMLKDFPDSQHSEEARYIIAKSSKDWADNSIYSKKEERFRKTIERCEAYLKRHSDEAHSDEIVTFKTKCEAEIKTIQNG